MLRYICNRLIVSLFTIWVVITIIFFLIRLLPGDPFTSERDVPQQIRANMLARFGLGGAPLMLVLSLLTFFAWTLVYLLQLLVLQPLPDLLRWLLGSAALLLAPLLAAFPTAVVLRPLRRLLLRLRPAAQRSLLGRVAVVSSPEVTAQQGRAMLADGGAGLVLQVRSAQGTTMLRGQAVLLVEYDRQAYCYHVVPADALEPASASRSLFESGDKESS